MLRMAAVLLVSPVPPRSQSQYSTDREAPTAMTTLTETAAQNPVDFNRRPKQPL